MIEINEKMKTTLLNFSLILFGIIIFFIILEIGLFLKIPFLGVEESNIIEMGEPIYYPDIDLWTYSNRSVKHETPEYSTIVSTNSIGFRDKEHFIEKKPDVFRIVILGDSFTYALQVPFEQTFSYLLEHKLNSNLNISKEIEIINLGISGFGTDQEYLTLKHIGLEFNPDLIILVLFTGNDVRNNYAKFENRYWHIHQNGNTTSNAHPFFFINESGKLDQLPFQYKYNITFNGTVSTNKCNIIDRILGKFHSPRYLFHKLKDFQRQKVSKGYEINGIPIDYHIYASNYSTDWEEAWNITKALILQISEESKEINAQFLLVSTTNIVQVHHEYWEETLETYPEMKNMELDLEKPEKELINFSYENNIIYLQLLPQFKEKINQTNEKVHGHYDNHWNANGHKFASEFIYIKLIEEQLVPIEGEK